MPFFVILVKVHFSYIRRLKQLLFQTAGEGLGMLFPVRISHSGNRFRLGSFPLALILLFIFSAAGWAGGFDFDKMTPAEQKMITMSPSLVSGDDFRKGQIEQRTFNISAMIRGEKEGASSPEKQKQDDYEKRLRRLEQQVGAGGGQTVPRWRPKAGILFAAGFAPSRAAQALLKAAPTVMASLGYIYLDPAQLQTVLNNFRYRQALNNPVAVAAFLGEYPGSRYLFFLEGARLPSAFPGAVELSFFVVDSYAGTRFPRRVVRENVTAAWQIDQALGRCLYQALSLLKPVVAQARPQGKVFLVQGPMVYLNVGHLSGFQPGRELTVLAPGHVVVDPRTGMRAGYVAGQLRGRIKILRNFGFDYAEARIISGQAMMGDLVE